MQIAAALWKSFVKQVTANSRFVPGGAVIFDPSAGRLISAAPELTLVIDDKALEAEMPAVAIDGQQLGDLATKRAAGDLEITTSSTGLTVVARGLRYQLTALPMPSTSLPNVTGQVATLPGAVMEALSFAALAAGGRKGDREFTASLQLLAEGDKITAAGTDGNRVNLMEISVRDGSRFTTLIPARLLPALKALGNTREISVTDDPARMAIVARGVATLQAIIAKPAVQFPDLRRAIPDDFKFEGTIVAEAMHDALEEVKPLLGEYNPRVQLNFAPGVLSVICESSEGAGKAEATLNWGGRGPAGLSVYIQHRFLADYFAAVPGDAVVRFAANQPHQPVWLEAGPYKLLAAPLQPPPVSVLKE